MGASAHKSIPLCVWPSSSVGQVSIFASWASWHQTQRSSQRVSSPSHFHVTVEGQRAASNTTVIVVPGKSAAKALTDIFFSIFPMCPYVVLFPTRKLDAWQSFHLPMRDLRQLRPAPVFRVILLRSAACPTLREPPPPRLKPSCARATRPSSLATKTTFFAPGTLAPALALPCVIRQFVGEAWR